MINRTVSFICIILGVALAGSALAADQQECGQLRGRGAGSIMEPSYSVVLMLFECSGMTKDVEALNPLDGELMVMRAKSLPLEKLREQQTETDPPRKYSELTSAERLAEFKQLVDAYYEPTNESPPDCSDCCPTAGCIMMHCPPPGGPMACCRATAPYAPC